MKKESPRALFIGAHPDDAEQFAGGTLLLMNQHGYRSTIAVVTDGGCGSDLPRDEIVAIRERESRLAAEYFGTDYVNLGYPDGELDVTRDSIRRIATLIQDVAPEIIFTHPIVDATPDHRRTGQLVRDAAILARLKNADLPSNKPPISHDLWIYHTDPQGLRDELGQFTPVNTIVDVSDVMNAKLAGFALHLSQMGTERKPVIKTELWGRIRGLQANVTFGEGFNQLYDPEWYRRENRLLSVLPPRRVYCF